MSLTLWKRSEGQTGHVFTFIFAMVVIVATIWIAGKLIGSFGDTACESEFVEFRGSFKQSLDANAVFGSRNRLNVPSPCGAVQLCLVDSRTIHRSIANGGITGFTSDRARVKISVENGVEENVFIFTKDESFPYYDERVILSASDVADPEFSVCLNATRGVFEFSTEGYGRYVRVGP